MCHSLCLDMEVDPDSNQLNSTYNTPNNTVVSTSNSPNERVKPVPKPRKSLLLKRSATINFRPLDSDTNVPKRSASTDDLLCELTECPREREEEQCTCPKNNELASGGTECPTISATSWANQAAEKCVQENSGEMDHLTKQRLTIIDEQLPSSSSTQIPLNGLSLNSSDCEFNELSMCDKVSRTQSIWLLREIHDRFSVSNLLGKKEPGTFIVRSSSQPQSLALSVRMPSDWPVEVEHYLIEQLNNGVKLQGSPNSFSNLVELVLCYILDGNEIQVCLRLPESIQNSRSFMDLQKLASLGQGFWSTMPGSPSYKTKRGDHLKMSQSMYGLAHEFQTEPRRRTTRLGTNAFSNDYYLPQDSQNNKRQIQMGVASGLLKKSYSAYGISEKSQDEGHISGGRSLKVKARRPATFLRNLFSINDQTGDKKSNKHENPTIRQPRTIAQSDYFLPNDSPYWTPQSSDQTSTFNENWPSEQQRPKKSVERLLSASSVGRRLKVFRGGGERKQQCTKDDMFGPRAADEAHHQVLRRQNTDLCASRLANFTPSNLVKGWNAKSMSDQRRYHTGPIVPPHTQRMSNNSIQNCIEELKQRRGNGSTSSKASSSRTEDSELDKSNEKTDRPVVTLRSQEKLRDLSSRLSVPNLSAHEHLNGDSRIPIAKLGRTPGTGELQIINEGLITPIVRRKYTNGNRQVVRIPPENTFQGGAQHSRAASDEQALSTQQAQRKLAESLAAELKTLAAETKTRPTDSDVRPSTFVQKVPTRTRSVNTGTSTQPSNEETPSFVHKKQPWTAPTNNRELKSRQLQIAKVKPQPVARTRYSTNQKLNTQKPMADVKANEHESTNETLESVTISSFEESKAEQEEDDCVSVAGTVFNEPWDSQAFENLMDIAQFNERPSKKEKDKAKNAFMECCTTHETIAEEEDACSLCESVCRSTASISPYSHVSNVPSAHHSSSDIEVQEEPLLSSEDHVDDELIYGRPCSSDNVNDVLNMANNKMWREMSKIIPSEPSTFDSRKNNNRARSMINVNVTSNHLMSPLLERQRMHAQTPGIYNNTTNFNDSMESFNSILPATSPARLRTTDRNSDPSQRIQNYIEKMAIDSNSTFGASLQCFIECTIDSENPDPRLAIRNARQFITGIKNFLINGDTMQEIIEQESAKLQSNEFLNLDVILEAVLHKIVLVPIKRHVYHLFCRESIVNGSFETLTSNLSLIRTLSMEKLGFPPHIKSPDIKQIELIRKQIRKMQNHYSPLKKFESMLTALSLLIRPNCNSTLLRADSSKKLPCTEVIRWFVYLLAKTTCVTCEIEACFMWELLPTQLLTTGHVIYYLSTLFSAIHILKNSDSIGRLKFVTEQPTFTTPQASLQACIDEAADGYFRCAIPNEHLGTIEFKIFPLISQLNVQRLCQIIANQLSISNNEEYGLFVLYDGYETPLNANECPLTVRTDLNASGKAHFFAYKRIDAKIAWPSSAVQLTSSSTLNQPIHAATTFGSVQSRYI